VLLWNLERNEIDFWKFSEWEVCIVDTTNIYVNKQIPHYSPMRVPGEKPRDGKFENS
jgi:hypothetical protein